MKINESSLKDLDKIGVYKITNLVNGKVYIGSTEKSFVCRYATHYEKLRTNNHKGYWHLQSAVNKYGIENFEYSILEICEETEHCIPKETEWIAIYNACNREKGYNINPKPGRAPSTVPEVAAKISQVLKEKYKNGEIELNSGIFKKGTEPWNKGKQYESTDHLKVKKKKKGSREGFKKQAKEKQVPIEVYNLQGEKIGEWRYYQDIIELSKNEDSIISKNMNLKNPKGRNGYPATLLFPVNIQKSCRTGKSYKGLVFKYRVHNKSGELMENPEEDNHEPS